MRDIISNMSVKMIHEEIKASEYKPWQVYLLVTSVAVSIGLYLEVGVVTSILQMIEEATSGGDWLVILGVQGVLIGLMADSLYEQGDEYAKSASHLFGSKDRTLFFRIGVMTVISGIITKAVPLVIESVTEYLVVQTTGVVILLGIVLVHEGSRDWNLETEWPAMAAGTILALAPSIL